MREQLKRLRRSQQKFVCIGLGKTGTTTFAQAMTLLGYNHKSQGHRFAFENRHMLPIWITLRRFDSFDDFPWPYLYKYIDQKIPRSKFILTTRQDCYTWLNSLKNHYRRWGGTSNYTSFYGYRSPFLNDEHFLRLYETHNDAVREYFRGSPRFVELCWERGHGWSELCGFLSREVPDTPFPHANMGNRVL